MLDNSIALQNLEWNLPSETEKLELVRKITRYAVFLNPEVVKMVVEFNDDHYSRWEEDCSQVGLKIDEYIWKGGACAYPGLRRYIGKKPNMKLPIDMCLEQNSFKFDDNEYPKKIWNSLKVKTNVSNLKHFSLAHILVNKDIINSNFTGTNLSDRFTDTHGLYTSVTNTFYFPKALIKPTDFDDKVKRLFFDKARDIYRDCCNILPVEIITDLIETGENNEWHFSRFEWGEVYPSIIDQSVIEAVNSFIIKRQDELYSFIEKLK